MPRYWLVPQADAAPGWSLDDFARAARLHPQLVTRLVRLGLLTPDTDASGRPRFPAVQLARLARIQRLRIGLGLNYAAVGVVLDLLDRIEDLESQLRTTQRAHRK
jgi:DNA-binding transcriptional MerR regulator